MVTHNSSRSPVKQNVSPVKWEKAHTPKKILTKVDRTRDESELDMDNFVKLPMPMMDELGKHGDSLPIVPRCSAYIM